MELPAELHQLAEQARTGDGEMIGPSRLWQLANEATGSVEERVSMYRHAMIHAGYLIERTTGLAYPVCPVCDDDLD